MWKQEKMLVPAFSPLPTMFSKGYLYRLIKSPDSVVKKLNSKIVDWLKLKAFADNNINVTQKLKFVLERVENNVGKGENVEYQHFLLFPHCFQKASFSRSFKVGIVWYCGKRRKYS